MHDHSQPGHQEEKKYSSSLAGKNITKEHFIVGIGASAGGLEAINELFDNIVHGNGYSFVVIQHLSPNYKSLMDELLAKHTSMKIERAEEGMAILPDRVYLIPSGKNMTIRHGKLRLTDKPSNHTPNNAIDIFLNLWPSIKKIRPLP
nr:chemotaxis protein CheB [Nafulsella turpanensis]